jgi:ABC-type nitrate/sulfonate/bicarbonate transport system substrate-binding protein
VQFCSGSLLQDVFQGELIGGSILVCLSLGSTYRRLSQVALDWTPSGNHAGIFVAKAQDLFAKAGMKSSVEIVSPHQDNYQSTPASKVLSGEVDIGIGPSETVISRLSECRPDEDEKKGSLVAVAALLQEDDSAIVTLKASGINSMKKLEGKRYASYGARYEGRIVQEMIRFDGGSGDYMECTPDKLGIWETILRGDMDATWVFMHWEGEEAKMKNVDLNVFRLKDYGITYGYPMVLFARQGTSMEKQEEITKFLKALSEAYQWIEKNVDKAAELMLKSCKDAFPDFELNEELVRRSVAAAASTFLDEDGRWGHMRQEKWDSFLDWLSTHGLLTTKIQSRNPQRALQQATLDGLRSGDTGSPIARDLIRSENLFTNKYL